MATNFNQQIRLHAWYKTANGQRTFVIGHLTEDFTTLKPLVWFYSRVGLVEFGFEDVIWLEFDEFKANIDSGAIIPMNSLPKLHTKPKTDEKTIDAGGAPGT